MNQVQQWYSYGKREGYGFLVVCVDASNWVEYPVYFSCEDYEQFTDSLRELCAEPGVYVRYVLELFPARESDFHINLRPVDRLRQPKRFGFE
jgi:hypothetical protein